MPGGREVCRAVPGAAVMTKTSELRAVSDLLKRSILGIGIMSMISNLLLLTGPLFMIAIYDHVIPTKNLDTLIGLIVLALIAYMLYGLADNFRARALARVGASFTEAVTGRVFDAVVRQPLSRGLQQDPVRPIRDIDEVRNYVSGPGAAAMFDVPWIPIYLGICFAFHPIIGLAVLSGALLLIVLTAVTEVLTRGLNQAASASGSSRNAVVDMSLRNLEVLTAMGMLNSVLRRWIEVSDRSVSSSLKLADRSGTFLEISRVFRMILQSAVLALGAYLVINGEASGGIIIASSILSSRALAPVDQIIATWRSLLAARQGWGRIEKLLSDVPPLGQVLPLPPPRKMLAVEGLSLQPPGSTRQTLSDISFSVEAGSAVAVLGPSGSGKSSLTRTLVGIWAPSAGVVRIDGSDIQTWDMDYRRSHVGYLPQDVELLEGTIALNIARFDENASPESVIAAATEAQVHDLILRLPNGYDTVVGPSGSLLSAGQKQRVALARALHGDPFLVVLDEPNSNLDAEGEAALSQAIQRVRQRGGIVIIVAHRESVLVACDRIAFIQNGLLRAYGRKEEVLRPRVTRIEVREPKFERSDPKEESAG
jgi:PrtD family type I secretion system ABC transporter